MDNFYNGGLVEFPQFSWFIGLLHHMPELVWLIMFLLYFKIEKCYAYDMHCDVF